MPVKPQLIQWALERSGYDVATLSARFPKLEEWQRGDLQPTLNQLENFGRATHTPFGFFFLSEPPEEQIPIPDFRTVGSAALGRPSPDLLDTIHLCQQRQDWYRTNAMQLGEDPVGFVGTATIRSDHAATARAIREAIGFDLNTRAELDTFEDALRMMIAVADNAGVLVMVSGIVGSNTHRPLDVDEFRGFALSDDLAPLVFINGKDTKAGQMFTLAHELAHLWLGQSALTDATAASIARGTVRAGDFGAVEVWCNAVAAEMLVPMESFSIVYRPRAALEAEKQRLMRHYKVSTLVILRRMFDAGGLSREAFEQAFVAELDKLRAVMAQRKERSAGGDPYATGRVRLSPRFARAVLASTWEGRSTFTEAFRLLGFRNVRSLERFGESLGMSGLVQGGPA
jgi:Zn-dependent peptidase ImmA (M78 family)